MPQAAQDRPTKPLLQAQAAAGLGPTRQSCWPCRAPLGGLAPRGPLGKAAALCRKALQPAGSAGPERPRRPVRTTPGPRVLNGRRVTDAEATAAPPTSSGVTRPRPPKDRPRPWKLSPGRDAERAVQGSSSAHPSALRVHPHAKCHVRANETVCLGGAPTSRPPEPPGAGAFSGREPGERGLVPAAVPARNRGWEKHTAVSVDGGAPLGRGWAHRVLAGPRSCPRKLRAPGSAGADLTRIRLSSGF